MRLTAEDLSARRGEDLLFSNICFSLTRGDALLLTGRNGSGKSTLLRVVAGLLPAVSGRLAFDDPTAAESLRPAEACHYLGHRNAMKPELTAAENLAFWKAFFSGSHPHRGLTVEGAAAAVELESILHLPFGYLSAGQQRRMAFAKLLVAHRPVWILDEPTAALDTAAEALFSRLIRGHLDEGGIALAATHQPLGLEATHRLEMKGFDYADMEVGV
jgi:heme exporter protein A